MELRLGLGLFLGLFLPISVAIASIHFGENDFHLNFLHLSPLLIIAMGCGWVLSSLLQSMIRRKRAAGDEADKSSASASNGAEASRKKPRVDCLKSCSSFMSNDSENVATDAMDGNPSEIDEDLHSRQLAVYGRETMRRLFKSNILVSGMQGLGVEIGMQLLVWLFICFSVCCGFYLNFTMLACYRLNLEHFPWKCLVVPNNSK